MRIIILLVLLILNSGCSATATADVGEDIELRINSHTVACEGVMEGECLLIQKGDKIGSEDWEYFYFKDDILGFEYEPGFIYDLAVKRIPVPDPPQDGSSFRYELIKILSKVKDEE